MNNSLMHANSQVPLCRASDPITSFEAADSARQFRETHESLIKHTLKWEGPAGVDDIAEVCRIPAHAVGKRVTKLWRDGAIELTGKYVTSRSGHRQREWRIA